MAKLSTGIAVRRNTAVSLAQTVAQPCKEMAAPDVPEGSYLFGFDASLPENESLIFAADSGATREPSQHYAEPFQLYTWAVKRIELAADETSPGGPHARCILIQRDGETLAFVSQGILGSLDLIRALRGDGPYDPPIPVLVTEEKTRHGFRVFKLVIHRPRTSAPAAK